MDAHTPPGVALVLVMLLAVTLQALSGLGTTDDIFIEGPLVRHLEGDLVGALTAAHHRIFYLVLGAIAVHLLAHLVYGIQRDPTPLDMFKIILAIISPLITGALSNLASVIT